VAAAARFTGREPPWIAIVRDLQYIDELTGRWTPTKAGNLDERVSTMQQNANAISRSLGEPDRRALIERVDDFVGAADALLGFEQAASTSKLTPLQSRHLVESRTRLWRELRRYLVTLTVHVERYL
jgi:hypothetical protein